MERGKELAEVRSLHVPGKPAWLESVLAVEGFNEVGRTFLDHPARRLDSVLEEHAQVLVKEVNGDSNFLPGMAFHVGGDLGEQGAEMLRL